MLTAHSDQNIIAGADWSDEDDVKAVAAHLWSLRDHKEPLERRAYRNEQFLFGNQWYVWDAHKSEMVPNPRLPGWRTRLVFNEILVAVERRIAKFRRMGRIWTTSSGTSDLSDEIVQRLTDQVMGWYWTDGLNMPEKMREALQWAMSSPVVFGHVYWTRDRGPKMRLTLDEFQAAYIETAQSPDQIPELARQSANRFWQEFGPDSTERGYHESFAGDVAVEVVPLYEMNWWPFDVKRWSDVRIWVRTVRKTAEEVSDQYNMPIEEVRKGNAGHYHSGNATTRWGDNYFWGEDFDANRDGDGVLIHTLYKAPTPKYPNGAMAVVLGDGGAVLWGPDDIPNALGVVPFFPLQEKPIRGRLTGTNIVDQLISAQEDLNLSASQVADYRNKKIMPTLVEFTGATNQPDALSNRPGKKYKCNSPDMVPQVVKMPDIGMDYFRTMDLDRIWMQNISGIASIDVGQTGDANVRSGRAIIALREQNDLSLAPFGEAIDKWLEDLGNLVLAEIQQKVTDDRVIQIIGEDNSLEVVEFRGADLRPSHGGGGRKNNVRVRAYGIVPKSGTEMMNFAAMAIANGLIDPVKDRNEILDALGLDDFRRVLDRRRPDIARQNSEIKSWLSGKPVGPPLESEDHQAHLEALERWMKSQEFRLLVGNLTNAQIAMDIQNHYQLHKKYAAGAELEKMYYLRRADASLWMRHRAEMMQEIAAASPPLAMMLANMVFPAPLTVAGGAPPPAGPNPEQKKPGEKPDAKPDNGKPRMPNGQSPDQGLSKTEPR